MSQRHCCPRSHPTISSLCSCDHNHHSWDTHCRSCMPQRNEPPPTERQNIIANLYGIIPYNHLAYDYIGESETKGDE